MKNNPYKIVKLFEDEISNFTGSKYAISIDSCTNALFLICKYLKVGEGNNTIKDLPFRSSINNSCGG